MKKIVLLFLFFWVSGIAQNKNLAVVYKVNGVDAYILNEPLRSYEIVYNSNSGLNWTSFITGGLVNNSISTKVGKFIKNVLAKAENDGEKIDAIIYSSGKNVTAVRYTDQETPENKGKARVQRLNGIPTYVMCDPLRDFRVIKSKRGGIKWKSALTAGLINNSVEEDLMKFAKKYKRKYLKQEIDALYYTGGKSCDGIIFTSN